MPTAVYASDRDFSEGALVSEAIRIRAQQAVTEACRAVERADTVSLAA